MHVITYNLCMYVCMYVCMCICNIHGLCSWRSENRYPQPANIYINIKGVHASINQTNKTSEHNDGQILPIHIARHN